MVELDDYLDPLEKIIWRGKPAGFKVNQNEEYMITNQRLLIKKRIRKENYWFERLQNIKKTIVIRGITGIIFGTGSIYPITETYPYHPQHRRYSEAGSHDLIKVYNLITEQTEEVIKRELYINNHYRPCLNSIKEPYKIQKILEEAIFGVGASYVNCEYCSYRYDLNKEGRCPNCGGIDQN
jgi:hypothetical protein